MSYSFSVKAATKFEAKQAVTLKFDDVIAVQPVHECDRAAALCNAYAVIDLLADDDTKDIQVSVNGYVSWGNPAGEDPVFSSVSIGCVANYTPRLQAPGQ